MNRVRHPLSAAFGDMPKDEFAALVTDIKKNGLLSAITTAEDGSILDGWHRYLACLDAGVKPRLEPFGYVVEPAAEQVARKMTEAEFVCAQNAHRRHLSSERRRAIVAELLKAKPDSSDRAIATLARVDHKTVGAARRAAEATGEIPRLSKTTGKDGRARKKPVRPKPTDVRTAAPRILARRKSPHSIEVDGVEVIAPPSTTAGPARKPEAEDAKPAPSSPAPTPAEDTVTARPVTLRPGKPEESAHALLQAWEPRDLVKFYSELGYAMQQRGMLSNWTEVIQDVLTAKAAG